MDPHRPDEAYLVKGYKDTRVHLVAELEALLPLVGATKAKAIRGVIEDAKTGRFHCFKSPEAMPKVLLVTYLRGAHLAALAARVIDGEFDEPADAEDQAEMSSGLHDSPELRRMLKLPEPGKS